MPDEARGNALTPADKEDGQGERPKDNGALSAAHVESQSQAGDKPCGSQEQSKTQYSLVQVSVPGKEGSTFSSQLVNVSEEGGVKTYTNQEGQQVIPIFDTRAASDTPIYYSLVSPNVQPGHIETGSRDQGQIISSNLVAGNTSSRDRLPQNIASQSQQVDFSNTTRERPRKEGNYHDDIWSEDRG